jgi:intracellular sulfur oxidation DsrE/DsrF family protein
MKNKLRRIFFSFVCILAIGPVNPGWAVEEMNDIDALESVQTTKTLFDINVSTANKLELYLQVIEQTYDDLVRQKQTPVFVIAFRGASVRLITTENWAFSDEDQESIKKAAASIHQLSNKGVKLEACSIATRLFKVDNKTILPEVKVVGNTFVSLVGYQTKGYALVPIQ